MRYCGHFLIKVEGGAKNYKRDLPSPLVWRSFTVEFVQQKGYMYVAVRQVICACSVVRNVGGVKCQLLSQA